jgi:hypothetical protein
MKSTPEHSGADPLGAVCSLTELPAQTCAHCRLGAVPGRRTTTLTTEQEIRIMSNRKAPALTLEDKQERVFQALANGQKLTKRQLVDATEMSTTQVVEGWRGLRGQADGHMWVMEPHREHTLYFASEECEPMLHYMLWQARRNYRQTVSLLASSDQLTDGIEKLRPDNGLRRFTRTARDHIRDGAHGYRELVNQLGIELDIPAEVIAKWIAV